MTALRVFAGEEESPARMTMRAAYETYILPEITGRRPKTTLQKHQTALGHWERFCRDCPSTVSTRASFGALQVCPVDDVYRIGNAELDAFARWCRCHRPGGPALAVDTIETTWKNLRPILRRLSPAGTGNPYGVGLIERMPVMRSVADLEGYGDAVIHEGAADLTAEQLGKLYEACAVATWPKSSVPARVQWRSFLVLSCLLGMRVEDLAAARADHFRLHPKSPVKGSVRRHEFGWLRYIPEKQTRSKKVPVTVPLPPCVRSHLDALIRHGRERLFDFGEKNSKGARRQWKEIAAEAGYPETLRKDLRDVVNQIWGAVDRDLGKWVMGHAARDINERHYTRIEPDLIAAIPQLDIPPEFLRRPDGQHQPTLF